MANHVGIINFTAPSNTVIGIPGLFTRQLPTASIIALMLHQLPNQSLSLKCQIAKPIPIDDIGETINIENHRDQYSHDNRLCIG